MRVLRRRHRTKCQNRSTPPLLPELGVTMRRQGVLGSGTHARYPWGVGDRKVNREAWARTVANLIQSETGGKKAPFARLVGVDPRTVDRWLKGEVDVSEESVRDVASALKRSPWGLLRAAGYYDERDLAGREQVTADPAIQVIMNADVPQHVKERLIERLQELRKRELEDIKFWIEQAREARGA